MFFFQRKNETKVILFKRNFVVFLGEFNIIYIKKINYFYEFN